MASLAPGDPLHGSLGRHGRRLLGIATESLPATTPPGALARSLEAHGTTLWLARIDQVEAVARESLATPGLAGVAMPVGSITDLAWARHAAERFQAAHGVEPVVAYAPSEAGGLIAMNTPPARSAGSFETTHKPDSLGRVLNGCVVWPRASDRIPLDRLSLAAAGIPDDAHATLAIAATLPCLTGPAISPRAALLHDALEVDKEGFLVPRGSHTVESVDAGG